MNKQGNLPTVLPATHSTPELPRYEAPCVSEKQQLEILQLASTGPQTGGSNGPDSGWFGHS
jgi:hypothetical protein